MLLINLIQIIEPLFVLAAFILKEVLDSTHSRLAILSSLEQMDVLKFQEQKVSNNPEFYLYLHVADTFTEADVEEMVVSTEVVVAEVPSYTESEIGAAELKFIDSLFQKQEDCPIEVPNDSHDPAMLSMADWDEEVTLTTVPLETLAAPCKIDDYVIGEQLWTVEVIGEEQNYLHVSDGTARAWIYHPSTNMVGTGDILSVLVNRISHEQVEMVQMDMLQKRSTDYLMLDEHVLEDSYLKAANGF